MEASSRTKPALSNSHGNTVNIVTWFLLVSSVLATFARLLTKRALNRNLSLDDATLLVALVSNSSKAMDVSNQLKPVTSYSVSPRQLPSHYKLPTGWVST